MFRTIAMGVAAGAVGTVALDITTYLDMFVRGRPASDVPAKTAEKLAAAMGISLVTQPSATSPADQDASTDQTESRKSGLGALLGYVAGLGVGVVYGAFTDTGAAVQAS